MPVRVVHTRMAFRGAVAVVHLARDLSQQLLHGLVKVFVVVVDPSIRTRRSVAA